MNCDRIAPFYRFLEYLVFGRALERRRSEYLPGVAAARRVLILGDGDGRFTAEFCKVSTAERIDSVDISGRMLALVPVREPRLHLHHANALTLEFPSQYDLVVTHFFLDCFTDGELGELMARIGATLKPGARWVVSEFCIAGRASALLIWTMYRFFRAATGLKARRLPDYPRAMTSNGFELVSRRITARGLLVSELYAYRPAQ